MSKQRKKCHFFVVVSNQISDKWPMFFVSWIPNQKCIIEWNWFVSVCLLQSMEWEIKQNNFYLDFFFCAFVSVATESRDSGHFYWVSRKSIFKCLFFLARVTTLFYIPTKINGCVSTLRKKNMRRFILFLVVEVWF